MPEKSKVVISGISGRFPECDDICTFKEKLYNGGKFVTIDNRRWPVGWKHKMTSDKLIPDATGKLLDVYNADCSVFKMSKTFARTCDILNRLTLEPVFEAIVDAGVNPYSMENQNVAVVVSTEHSDIDKNVGVFEKGSDYLALAGSNKAMLSNRISFALDLKGSSITLYDDPHGGLEALTIAFKYVSDGLAEAAIVGVASTIVDPRYSLQFAGLGLLTPDGIPRPFDELANGYVRSEGVVFFYLQRAEDAKRNYGEILFCDCTYLGSYLPNLINYDKKYLPTVMRHLHQANNITPDDISSIAFLEMNAYGNKITDEMESMAVSELLSTNRKNPLLVGSIKSSIGNTEAASGNMAVLKALLALDTGTIAPNQHLQKLNENIEAFKQKQLQVVTEKISLPGNIVAVNSVGLFGTVGMATIKQHEKLPEVSSRTITYPRIALICGRDENALKTKMTQIEKLSYDPNFISLLNDAFGSHMPHHMYRGFTLLPTPCKPAHDLQERGERNRPVWFIFSGMGSQWPAMGKSLLSLPLFAETVARCDKVLRGKNIDIYEILTSTDPKLFDDIVNAFVGIITVQIGLYEVIKALGIQPDGIIGHSVGENGCAYVDGCLTLEQAVLASWARGVASREVKTIKGMMAAVGMGYADIKDRLPDDIQVACHNAADSCTLTGPAESVNNFVVTLKKENIFAKAVSVANIAYHSKYIRELGPKLLHRLEKVIPEPRKRSPKWVSTSIQEDEWNSPLAQTCSPEYLTNNLLSPVLFEEGCKHIPANAICIEFAPQGLLQAILKRSLPDTCTNIPLTSRLLTEENLNFLLTAIGKLYISGLEPRVNDIYPKVEYPVPRGTHPVAPYCTWYHENDRIPIHLFTHYEEEMTISGEPIPIRIREDSEYAYLKDYKIHGNITLPPALYMYLVWKMISYKRIKELGSSSVIFENVKIHKEINITLQDLKYVSVMVHYGSGYFEVTVEDEEEGEDFQIVLTGTITLISENIDRRSPEMSDKNKSQIIEELHFYDAYKYSGQNLGEEFALVHDLYRNNSKYETDITWNGNWVIFLDILMKIQMFADENANRVNILPRSLRRLEISAPKLSSLEKGTFLPCILDTNTRALFCSGVAMYDLKYKSLHKPEKRLMKYQFVPYENPRCEDVREFLKLCIQMCTEGMPKDDDEINKFMVLNMVQKNEHAQIIKQIIEEEVSSKLTHPLKISSSGNKPMLVITDTMSKVAKLESYTKTDDPLILVISSDSSNDDHHMKDGFLKVMKQTFSKSTFTLLKRNHDPKRTSPYISKNVNGVPKSRTQTITNGFERDLVDVRKNIEVDDVSRLVGKKNNHSKTKYLYVMDDITDEQIDELKEKQLNFGVPTSVFKDGEWGTYRNVEGKTHQEDGYENYKNTDYELLAYFKNNPLKIECICTEVDRMATNNGILKQNTAFAYAGITTSAEKIMGIARTSSNLEDSEYDPYLYWTIPPDWNAKDAAVISFIYAQAYHLLVPENFLHCPNSVLLNVGNEYGYAEALISLSLHRNLEIFVTVKTDEEAVLFGTMFPKLKSCHILRTHDYDMQVRKKTGGRGVDLVINCLSGIQHVDASLKCVNVLGFYLELGNNNCLESYDIGLYDFIRSITFRVVKNEASNLLESSVDTKKNLKETIERFITDGVIVPFRIKFRSSSMKVMEYQFSSNIEPCRSRVIKYDRKHSYVIVGADTKDNLWIDVVEWLICRGAQKFVVFLEKMPSRTHKSHQLSRFIAPKNVNISLVSASKLDDKHDIVSILNEIKVLGPIGAIFFEKIKGVGKMVANLDELVSPNIPFIGLSSGTLKEFEHRNSKGSLAILVHSVEPRDSLIVLPNLDDFLNQEDNNNTAKIFYSVENLISRQRRKSSFWLQDYLPRDMETLISIGRERSENPIFTEMSSLSRRYCHCKGVYPIFALPAVHSTILQPLFQRLLYPVFSATTSCANFKDETADQLYRSLSGIQPSGPVTLISETWTLPLALKLVSQLQLAGRKYKIFILEGNPRNWIRQIYSRQDNFADIIFHFAAKVLDGKLGSTNSISFENKVKMYAESFSSNTTLIRDIVNGADTLREILSNVAKQQSTVTQFGLLSSATLIERRRPHDKTFKLSTSSEILVFDEPNYQSLLVNTEVNKIMNENVEFSWWRYDSRNNVP